MKTERFLSQNDAATLSSLAENLLRMRDVKLNFGEKLIDLIATSVLLPENAGRPDCVALNTRVTYREIGAKESHSMEIVCPQDANDTLARVSILAPLAMALLGRPAGSIVEVTLPFGKVQFIEVMAVQQLVGHVESGNATLAAATGSMPRTAP